VVRPLAQHLRSDPDAWIKVRLHYASSLLQIGKSWKFVRIKCKYEADFRKFMMDFELKLEKPKSSRGWKSALMMGISYFLGMSFGFKVYSSTFIPIFRYSMRRSSDLL
jgi:hypothetical protein